MDAVIKLDLKKEYAAYLKPSAQQPQIVDVPPLRFLMIDGMGDPNTSQAYREAVEALYSTAYTLKFYIKSTQAMEYPVMALEGLWWAEDSTAFLKGCKDEWLWTMMIMQPDLVTADLLETIKLDLAERKHLPALSRVRLDTFHEGLCAQILHIGTYAAEAPTIEKLHAFIVGQGRELAGKHHEIYLSDPSRGDPNKTRTIIRQPMR